MKKVLLLIIVILLIAVSAAFADIVPLWDLTLGGKVVTFPAISNNQVYLVAEDRNLYALSFNGELNWKLNIREWARDSLAVGPDGTIYVCTGFGNCLAVNRAGRLIWKFDLDDEPAGSPTIDFRGNIYIPTRQGKIFSISHTGRRKWVIELPAPASGPMTMDSDGTLYVTTSDERIYAIDRFGEELWVFLCAGVPGQVVPAGDNLLICGTGRNTIVALSKEGKFGWNVSFSAPLHTVLFREGIIIAIDTNGQLCSFDNQGNKLSEVFLNEEPAGGMIAAEVIHVFGTKGNYYTVSYEGELLQTFSASAGFTGSVISKAGIIFAGNENWHVYAFNAGIPGHEGWLQRGLDSKHSSNLQGYGSRAGEAEIPDKFHTWTLREFAAAPDRELKFSVLEQIDQDYQEGVYFANEDLYNELLYYLLADGVIRQDRYLKRVINDFPQVRAAAADLMGKYGNLLSIRQLESMLSREKDEAALRRIIAALGNLGSDPEGRIVYQFNRIIDRINSYDIPEKIIAEIIRCLYKIGKYSANYEEIAALAVRLYGLDISPALKEDALQVLESIRE